jgi:hypothetical protein
MTRVSSGVAMIEPVWRSPWISASVAVRKRSRISAAASFRSASAAELGRDPVELGPGPAVERRLPVGAGEDDLLGGRAQLALPAKRAMSAFFACVVSARSEVRKSVRARKVPMCSARRG